ncbi:amidophosphoribosyltransferase, partial [bacterium]|nr:amidophosphoribosyltransferase [bacterium]
MSGPKEKCGVFGIFDHPEAAWLTYLGLYALQHRGQEGAGICTSDGKKLHIHRAPGLVSEVFHEETFAELPGRAAIGHNRYSTTGGTGAVNLQPMLASYRGGSIAVAHNGNLVNAREVREECEHLGSIFQTTSDSEVIVHLLARARPDDLIGRLRQALSRVRGAYSLVALTPDCLIGLRDPAGIRPLCLGRLGDSYVVASESCALDILNATYEREVEPGEMVVITKDGLVSHRFGVEKPRAECVFEHVYFARPDSRAFGRGVNEIRVRLGRALAREHPVDADLVMSVPDSSNAAALGFSRESGIPLEHGLIRNHYVGRTFISPSQTLRDLGVRLKFNVVREAMNGRRVVIVDDSVVRGTTSRSLLKMVREAGASEVHLRISSPPVTHPCYYGIDMPTHEELLAHNRTMEDLIVARYCDEEGRVGTGWP